MYSAEQLVRKEEAKPWQGEGRAEEGKLQSLKPGESSGLKEALFYKKLPGKGKKVQCRACNRFCVIAENENGFCSVRKNIKGKLYSLVYGRTLTLTIDPIEKKPLFHFKPGSTCLGVSTYGCNFSCLMCQNYSISKEFNEEAIHKVPYTSPPQIVEQTLKSRVPGIAYTYTEPTVFVEYALDTMKHAKSAGLYNVWVSNGYMTKEVADAIIPFLDAVNIDLKGDAEFYKKVCGNAKIEKVKENIKYFHKKGVHVEVTNLIVPGYNDKDRQFKEVAAFIASVSKTLPLHFSKFSPLYKLDYLPATPDERLVKAKEIAEKAGLKYVYLGNTASDESTYCSKCKSLLVQRLFFASETSGLDSEGRCRKCGAKADFML